MGTYNTHSQNIPNSLHLDGETASNDEDISNLFSTYFSLIYKKNPILSIPPQTSSQYNYENSLPSHYTILLD